jgi:hypothetical protein
MELRQEAPPFVTTVFVHASQLYSRTSLHFSADQRWELHLDMNDDVVGFGVTHGAWMINGRAWSSGKVSPNGIETNEDKNCSRN